MLLCYKCQTPTDESELVWHPTRDYEPWCEDCHEKGMSDV